VIPGETRPVRAVLSLPDERVGVLTGHLPATRSWDVADQDLLELFASEVAVAVRNAELFAQVQEQTRRLVELDAVKDDFFRGVSHNLQTPLTSIRAYADQLQDERPDRRIAIIAEQSQRLSRMVRQLVMVSRLESGALRPRLEVLALGPRVQRAWEALGAPDVPFELEDAAAGWLAVADPDQLDQVLWAILDNAIKYGRGSAVRAGVRPDPAGARLLLTISDGGPGVAEADRGALFERYARGDERAKAEGTGIGLYVSRALCREMGGWLDLEPAGQTPGAAFTITLPAESPAASEA
jgi:two-component system sensor histidine kinase KdpD